ncbi:MAG: transcription-repair coupling factor [Bacteroidales bacterium]|nr:transcription-repair coupling factor [Clostridium sp.]MCM1203367.1 transcription-repair coupling factor [Bacteroidales bacterium]
MEVLRAPFRLSDLGSRHEQAKEKKKMPVEITGTDGFARYYTMDCLGADRIKLIVTYSEDRAKEILEEYSFFDRNSLYYPAKDVLFYSADIHGHTILRQRMEVVKGIIEGKVTTVVVSIDALLNKVVPLREIRENIVSFCIGEKLELDKMKKQLIALGYERNDWVDGVGQFAVRGGILDIFPMSSECPYRIELWGEEIDSIRSFDAESQRSIENTEVLSVYPAAEMVLNEERIAQGIRKLEKEHKQYADKLKKDFKTEAYARINKEMETLKEELSCFHSAMGIDSYIGAFYGELTSFLYYLPEDTLFFVDEPTRVLERANACQIEFRESMISRLEGGYMLPSQADILFDYQEIAGKIAVRDAVLFSILSREDSLFEPRTKIAFETKMVPTYRHNFEMLLTDIRRWKREKYRILLFCPSATRGERLAKDLQEQEINCFFSADGDRLLAESEMMITAGRLKAGFCVPEIKLVVLSEGDIFGQKKTKPRMKRKPLYAGEKIQSFDDLNIGDYVVHEKHGLGIYLGIEKIEVDGIAKDYIAIEYSGGAKLFILASQLDLIQKYSSKESRKPKLNKLGGSEWEKTKSRVRGQVKEIAKELVDLYAIRQSKEGYAFSPDTVWQREFEEMFPYEETEDQIKAIEDTKADMQSTKIMDRLICGDVGYGKTEVAIRAAFKAVQDGKQVAYLVPTTILAQQHYNTFLERMQDFPVKVGMMSRFLTPKEQKKTLEDLKRGQIDIVIGTHRLLSKDMDYRNLGLLIIDEEQRFGVTHKEKIKQMKKDVDVLTLTATPIPRTLHMSLIGIRDMSLLEEPPVDRKAIQTYVLEYNQELVKEAISRELSRGGQVYYVYNRVNNIVDIASDLAKMLPDVRISFAHGQMKEKELEDVMFAFINKEIDVLVTTTIIETGLDIANVNTMIIHDAENFGLSQLYQLRGRVGRSNRTAYAFLMYKRNKMLKETAEKRLKAIREFTDLGSGFKIAMRDLEIRGAGNLLGADQSGHMAAVGYDLYCKMLNDAILAQKGEVREEEFATAIEIPVDAYIPSTYVKNEMTKLELYKRISGVWTKEDYEDILDELTDRFGEPPYEVLNLLTVARLKAQAHAAYIASITYKNARVHIEMAQGAKVKVELLDDFLVRYMNNIRVVAGSNPGFVVDLEKKSIKNFIHDLEKIIEDIDKLIEK